jgi:hypothetical protein
MMAVETSACKSKPRHYYELLRRTTATRDTTNADYDDYERQPLRTTTTTTDDYERQLLAQPDSNDEAVERGSSSF